MLRPSKTSLSDPTDEVILHTAFERLRERLIAMIERRIGRKLASRVDPEGVIQEAYLRARTRWQEFDPKPADLDTWVYGQVHDRLIERIRVELGPMRDIDRDVGWPEGSVDPLAEHLVDSQTGPTSVLSRAERREVVRIALYRLDFIDREILAWRFYHDLNYEQIGEILHISQNAATKRGLRAMIKLRDLIPPAFRPPEARKP